MTKTKSTTASLSEVNASVDVNRNKGLGRKLLAFMGPAYLVSVGYMDPGNWATDIAGGSQFGYKLIWVLLMSNLIALLLQSLSARLGIVRGRDLAQASRELYPKTINLFLYVLAEIAIAACDLAEVLGMAIGLKLLFGLPLTYGVVISVLDTFLLLFLLNYGIRKMEAFIITLVFIIGLTFVAQMFFAQPVMSDVMKGFIPSLPNSAALYIAIGIIGATVMPHNLYLHSSLVQTRKFDRTAPELRKAIRYNIIDSAIALNAAFFVNAAILILAAAAFFSNGFYQVADIMDAHRLLEPLLGTKWAPILFAVALLCAGQSSTITGTLAGQIVMEGYLNLRIQPWLRRIITRSIAIIPAFIVIQYYGEAASGSMLILSQVILSLQLGFAVIPLIHFVSDKHKMKEFVIPGYVKILAWLSAAIIVSLNVELVYEQLSGWLVEYPNSFALQWIVVPLAIVTGIILIYITIVPLIQKQKEITSLVPHGSFTELLKVQPQNYYRIAIAIDFSEAVNNTIGHALSLGRKDSKYLLLHINESAGAFIFGKDSRDYESVTDLENIFKYAENLRQMGYDCEAKVGYGNPKIAIVEIVKEYNADLLVMGAHGHTTLKDLILGTTVDAVRHKLEIPVMIVR